MKKRMGLMAAACLLTAMISSAAADGLNASGYSERYGGLIGFTNGGPAWDGGYRGTMGGTYSGDKTVQVISQNASVWQEARTNSSRLGRVSNGEKLACEMNGYGEPVMQDGFYRVEYKGRSGWINGAYCVYSPTELVLMESNVPAYCAPDSRSPRVGSLSKLTRYTLLGYYNEYFIINLREAAAYIPRDTMCYDTSFTDLYDGIAGVQAQTAYETTLRSGPGTDYAKVETVRAGYGFTYVDKIDGWYMLRYDGKAGDGYVFAEPGCAGNR